MSAQDAYSEQFVPLPTEPAGQVHVKPPSVLVQVATGSHIAVPSVHSLTSAHVTPSPSKPFLQLQVKLPVVLVQVAFGEQLS